METMELKVDGMTCGGCEGSIVRAISLLAGVTEVRADHGTGKVAVSGTEVARDDVVAAIEDAGYAVLV